MNHSRRTIKNPLEYESLEPRQLLAVSVTLEAGNLRIQGDAGNNQVTVSPSANNEMIDVWVDGQTQYQFESNQVNQVFFLGGHGDDLFDSSTDLPTDARGHAGNDSISSGNGDDLLIGGPGADVITSTGGSNKLIGGLGDDQIEGGHGPDLVFGGQDNDTIHGGLGNDTLYGDWGDDLLYGEEGDDLILGYIGSDTIYGADGNDRLYGQADSDSVYGGPGNDIVRGGADNDLLEGNDGHDHMMGDLGDDQMRGGTGIDVLYGYHGNDSLRGGAGSDRLYGQDGADELSGGDGDDLLRGGAGDDLLEGMEGNDRLGSDDGDDVLYGGPGDDTLLGNDGTDTLYGQTGADTLYGHAGNDLLYGGEDNDFLSGDDGADTLYGQAGEDSLYGNAGNDLLRGGEGNDQLRGGLGADSLFGGSRNDYDQLWGQGEDDRFLTQYGDFVHDRNGLDAQLAFVDSSANWTDKEIEVLDRGFAQLHERTGNTRLLKDTLPTLTGPLAFYKEASLPGNSTAVNSWQWWYNGWTYTYDRQIRFAEWNEENESANQFRQSTVIHEIAHNWDSELELTKVSPALSGRMSQFQQLSQWTQSPSNWLPYVESRDGQWWYLPTSANGFAREYGKTNPYEDLATAWEYYFSGQTTEDPVFQSKLDHIDQLFNDLA